MKRYIIRINGQHTGYRDASDIEDAAAQYARSWDRGATTRRDVLGEFHVYINGKLALGVKPFKVEEAR